MTISIGGMTRAVEVTFTNTAVVTAYTAKDVVTASATSSAVLTFTEIARDIKCSGYITKAVVQTDQKGFTARLRLHLFNTLPTVIMDNSPMLFLYANHSNYVGKIDFSAAISEDSTSSTGAFSINDTIRTAFISASGDNALYGVLETLDAFTPNTSQNFSVTLYSEQN